MLPPSATCHASSAINRRRRQPTGTALRPCNSRGAMQSGNKRVSESHVSRAVFSPSRRGNTQQVCDAQPVTMLPKQHFLWSQVACWLLQYLWQYPADGLVKALLACFLGGKRDPITVNLFLWRARWAGISIGSQFHTCWIEHDQLTCHLED